MTTSPTTLTFLGGAGSVTGSKHLLTVGGRRILVDCGMFQGEKTLRLRNWAEFPVDPATVTDVLVTHAHMDHVGYLPALVRGGFTGRIHCTDAAEELIGIVLRDAGHLQERDAEDAAEGGYSKHTPPLPLYRSEDVERTLPLLSAVPFDTDVDLGDGVTARWVRAGHILGSASIRVVTPTTSAVFSGDLGRADHPVLKPREVPEGAAYVLVESTYGDREHPEPENLPHEGLADVIRRTVARGGSVLIPAFAVDRTEVILKALTEMRRDGRIPMCPIYVNSPMATDALAVYQRHPEELRPGIDPGDFLDVADLHAVRTADESRALTAAGPHRPSVILSSSGMATGGRVLNHLESMLPDARNAVVLTGYQAVGTRGRALAEGATRLKMHGRYVGVRAEVLVDKEFSVHGDASDLLDWVAALNPAPVTVFCVHGEPAASAALARRIEAELGLQAVVPELDEVVLLDGRPPLPKGAPAAVGARHEGSEVPMPVAGIRGTGSGSGKPHAVVGRVIASDLTARAGDDPGTIVLDGTVTVRLEP